MSRAMRSAGVLVLVVAVGGCSGARPARPVQGPAARGPIRQVLPNGIPVIVEELRGTDTVAVQLWVRAGGRDEGPTELGLAHCLEHMLFKGTASRPPGFIEREVQSVGGRINAGTSWDYTFYHALLPARQLESTIAMLADVALNASLDATLLEAEKQAVLEEMRLDEQSPSRFLVRELFAAAWQGHPYGRPVIGQPEMIRGISREALVAFYRRHYVPEMFALVVVGSVNAEDVLRTARATLGQLPRSGGRRLPPPAPPPARAVRLEVTRPVAVAHLGLAWLTPRLDHADTPALDLLASILGRTRGSRLVASLQERRGLVNGIGTNLTTMEGGGLLMITAQLPRDNLGPAEREILGELRRVREDGVTAAELRQAITAAAVEHGLDRQTAEGRARAWGRAETIWTIQEEVAYLDRIRSVTRAHVQAVARRYLDPAHHVRIAVVPPR